MLIAGEESVGDDNMKIHPQRVGSTYYSTLCVSVGTRGKEGNAVAMKATSKAQQKQSQTDGSLIHHRNWEISSLKCH